ncbi:helix-turn-helix domain-containing protein [Spirosoma soli]|uniref:Helix-turn-helix domain-containing protein n=1 Tax=Spirosoma soli TaxID=1770529 RepID=A0ABW5LXE2_9BACT
MKATVYVPHGLLALFVDKLWHIEANDLMLRGLNLPTLHTEWVINFSDHFAVQQSSGSSIITDESSWLSGLQTTPLRTITAGQHETMGALLKPWGLYALTGIGGFDLVNQTIASQDLVGPALYSVLDRLQQTNEATVKLKILERFLVSRYVDKDIPAYLFYASHYLQEQPFQDGIISDLCATLRISRKSLNESFQKYIGLSPSHYLRLNRFRTAAEAITTEPGRKLTDIAHQHHFFDQAHFIRLFREFANMTPGDYQKFVRMGSVNPFAATADTFSPSFIWEAA